MGNETKTITPCTAKKATVGCDACRSVGVALHVKCDLRRVFSQGEISIHRR